MSTMDRLSEARAKRSALENGNKEAITAVHQTQKMTARERISALFDAGSFVELGAFVKPRCKKTEAPAEGVVTGYGTVDGRPAYAYAQDVTVIGGSMSEMHVKKILNVYENAMKTGVPVIALLDSNGARLDEGLNALTEIGKLYRLVSKAGGVIPQIAVVMGNCAGGMAMVPALSDVVVMVEKNTWLGVNGPQVLEAVCGDKIENSAEANWAGGTADIVVKSDAEALAMVRELIGYLPSNNLSGTEWLEGTDDFNRTSPALETLIPDDLSVGYDMKAVISEIVDNGAYIELKGAHAQNVITALARLGGQTVGIIANQPLALDGALDGKGAEKAAAFVQFLDCFGIPAVTLVDVNGFVIDAKEEKDGLSGKLSCLAAAYAQATMPMVTVVVRKAYGSAYLTMGSKAIGADMVYAWPTAEIAMMEVEGAANIMYREDLLSAADPIAFKKELVEKFREEYANPFHAAATGQVDEIIEPSETRAYVIAALEMLATKSAE